MTNNLELLGVHIDVDSNINNAGDLALNFWAKLTDDNDRETARKMIASYTLQSLIAESVELSEVAKAKIISFFDNNRDRLLTLK